MTLLSDAILNELGLVCALGRGRRDVLEALREGRAPGMRTDLSYSTDGLPLRLGHVDGPLPSLEQKEPRDRSRTNQLILSALMQIRPQVDEAVRRYGHDRVGVVMGTSTSGISEAEGAFFEGRAGGHFPRRFHYGQMEIGSPSGFVARELGLSGPAFTVSTACSSSAKALISARRLLRSGLCDAVIAGGADSLCRLTSSGFLALEAVSREPCRPFGKDRTGINIGEAAALFLVSRVGKGPVLKGAGESSDAHHISAPLPDGSGAATAMRAALKDAGLEAADIDYVNAHGTATPQNDAMESRAVSDVLGPRVPLSSTKPLSGHTLGAAGALEAAFCWLLLEAGEAGFLPFQPDPGPRDDSLPYLNLVYEGPARATRLRRVMSNAFGFGGSNTSLILCSAP